MIGDYEIIQWEAADENVWVYEVALQDLITWYVMVIAEPGKEICWKQHASHGYAWHPLPDGTGVKTAVTDYAISEQHSWINSISKRSPE
jgi:hypothetical protein